MHSWSNGCVPSWPRLGWVRRPSGLAYDFSIFFSGPNGYDRDLNQVRCDAIVRRVEQLFPGAGDTAQAQFWTGLRPATPSNLPIIGQSRLPNLYLNTGHGTLGWTHACGSGKSVARIVSGLAPEVGFAFVG